MLLLLAAYDQPRRHAAVFVFEGVFEADLEGQENSWNLKRSTETEITK